MWGFRASGIQCSKIKAWLGDFRTRTVQLFFWVWAFSCGIGGQGLRCKARRIADVVV